MKSQIPRGVPSGNSTPSFVRGLRCQHCVHKNTRMNNACTTILRVPHRSEHQIDLPRRCDIRYHLRINIAINKLDFCHSWHNKSQNHPIGWYFSFELLVIVTTIMRLNLPMSISEITVCVLFHYFTPSWIFFFWNKEMYFLKYRSYEKFVCLYL